MIKRIRLRSLFTAFLLLAWPFSVSATDPNVGLLLRWQITTQELGPPDPTVEYLIYKDGLVIARTLPSAEHDDVSYLRAVANPTALKRLKAALTQNRIGQIQAPPGCAAVNPFPTSVDYTAALTWFGKNGRQKHFTLNDPGFEPCPGEINQLVLVIENNFISGELTYQDVVTTVP